MTKNSPSIASEAPEISSISGHILVVEDEPRLAGIVCDYLRAAGCTTRWIGNGAEVMGALDADRFDLVLLDLMLPNRNGIDLCKDIRRQGDLPVIMVTARVEEIDRLIGLDAGADDYVCKPFSPKELVARVKAVLRRYRSIPAKPAAVLQLDEPGARFAFQGACLELTPIEFRLLRTLASLPQRVWSRDRLMDAAYPDHRIMTDRTVDSHIRNVRRKLMEAGAIEDPIRSIYGVGYSLNL